MDDNGCMQKGAHQNYVGNLLIIICSGLYGRTHPYVYGFCLLIIDHCLLTAFK